MRAPAQPDEDDGVAESSPPLSIRLLGELDLRAGGDRLAPVESARGRSLLGYLLLHRDAPHSRQRLAFLLWPDSTEAQARTNLRKVLHTLRHDLPMVERYLEVTPRTLQWRREEPVWVDAMAFEAFLAQAEDAGAQPDEAVDALRCAVGLYRGDLLDGCYDEWLVEERERFRDRYTSALRRLTELLAGNGEHAEAIRCGRELLRCDPLQEDTYRLLMRIHDAAGDRAGAARVYHECVTTLQRELGVDPSAATSVAYATLTRSDQPNVDTSEQPVQPHGVVLVGRDDEWQQLSGLWRDAESGRAQLVVVTGEPGVGKTRLVEELSAWCAHRGAVTAHARSYPTEGELGYGVVISWLHAEGVGAHLRTRSPSDLTALARLLPELDAPGEPVSEALDEAEQRRRLFDAVARALTASGRPTLLVADDAQWCDAQSLALIHYVVRLEPSTPTLVVATVRREELDDSHPLSALLSGLQRIDRASEIPLGRLNRGDTEALARELDFDTARADDLYAETEGNPLFLVESIRAAREGAGEGPGLTPKLQAVITARLRQCSDAAAEVLAMAATVGRAFTADLVRVASGGDDVTLVRAFDELWRRGVIREHGADGYDFSHGKIRDVVYERLGPATRRRKHLLVAEALQQLQKADLDAVSGQVAGNYDRAGQVEDAVAWYERAAVQAQRRYADVEAVRLLERARELVPALPGEVRLGMELAIVSALPTVLVGVDGFASDRLEEAQRRALEVADILGVEPEPPLLRSLVMSRLCRHDFDGARTAASQLRASAERAGDDGLLVESGYLLGIAAFWAGRLETARAHFHQVVDRFRAERRSEHLLRFGHDPAAVCLSRLGNTLWFLGRPDDARRASDDAAAMAIEAGHPYTRAAVHGFAALLSIDLGDAARVRAHVEALSQEEHLSRPTGIFAEAFAGYVDVLDGRTGAGIGHIRAAIDSCGPVDPAPGVHACFRRVLLAAHEAAGDAEGGLEAADEALRLGGSRLWEAEIRRLRAEFLAATGGTRNEVEAELARASAVARTQGALGLEGRVEQSRSRLRLVG